MRGCLVALEGGEGSGKSTQAVLLAKHLGAVLTREPGGCELGEGIRRLLLDQGAGNLDTRAEALLFLAARAQHVSELILPALTAGRWVVADRFVGSTLAYQGYGKQLGLTELASVSTWATCGIVPDLSVLIDITPELLERRVSARGGTRDRFEIEGSDFHKRVLSGYRELARSDPEHWEVVAGSGSVDEVASEILAVVTARLGLAPDKRALLAREEKESTDG
ncbi:MAG: dTMP kinase [Actinomycetota bacterium]|jgi:dTMP kinase|nr:dTMP kinase [Actinomycetota bacterium]